MKILKSKALKNVKAPNRRSDFVSPFLFIFFIALSQFVSAQNVGIGTTLPHPNASLDIQGINQGLLIPRGDMATRSNLSDNTAKGLMMYDTTTEEVWLHTGNGLMSGWQNLSTGPHHWIQSGDLGTEITNTNTGGIWSANPSVVLSDPGLVLPPVSGPGTRLMWIPQKSAFRVGSTDAGHWDAENIGLFSFAGGLNTIANTPYAFAMGVGTSSKGLASTSLGWFTSATGHSSVSAGFKTRAKSYSSFAIGRWNDSIAISNNTTWINTDPIFMIGNGKSENARHNAMVVYKNGNMVMKNPLPFYFTKLSEDYEIPVDGEGTRMMWLPELSAFRVGTVSDTAWDATNIGNGSFATGFNSIASGEASAAFGFYTKASGSYSMAVGLGNVTRGYSSLAVGYYNDPILTSEESEMDSSTPLFIIGNGDGENERHNAMVVRKDGNVGIGTSSPGSKLHINGAVLIADGTQGAGKVLTSDATGLASWQSPPPPPGSQNGVVGICCQSWMTKNLDVRTYRNGDTIPEVSNPTTWESLTTGAYCYFNNDSTTYGATYGKLYNWYAVNDPRGLAPEGWHIPSDFEWTTLGNCLGGNADAGGPLKEINTTHWYTPNTGATNISGFTGLPGGVRGINGDFFNIDLYGVWWSATEKTTTNAWGTFIQYNSAEMTRYEASKVYGYSIRCIKD